MLALPIEEKVKIIREFKPVEKPNFLNNETLEYVIWLLYYRVYDSIQSFLFLLDNKKYYDACVIAGQILEACAVLSYIKDNNPEKQIENYNKYLAKCSVSRLITILYTDRSNNLKDDLSWATYFSLLNFLSPIGANIIKKDKLSSKTRQERHKEIIEKIKYRDGINTDKIELLRKSYERSDPEGYIRSFSKKIDHVDDGEFSRYYMKYCDFKHSNILSPGIDSQDIDLQTVDWPLDILLGVVAYLHHSKLSAINLESFFKSKYPR